MRRRGVMHVRAFWLSAAVLVVWLGVSVALLLPLILGRGHLFDVGSHHFADGDGLGGTEPAPAPARPDAVDRQHAQRDPDQDKAHQS